MRWVQRRSLRSRATLRLFCIPHAGGGAAVFHRWPAQLPETIEVCAIQLPGRGSRLHEAPYTRLSSLVEALAEALSPYLEMPFAFFGHSMGALVSFELARRLRRREGLSPVLLIVSACGAPPRPFPSPPLHSLPDAAFIAELDRFHGTPQAVVDQPELMQLLLPALRADFEMCETYVDSGEPPLDAPISAYGGLQDDRVSHERLGAWREQTRADFSLRKFPGGHFFLRTAEALLVDTLGRELCSATP